MGRVVLAILAGLAVVLALWYLVAATAGVAITRMSVGKTPVTIFASCSAKRAPVVVIAHGFAGSQQLMQSFALALAR
ncbi:MAG TPA: alpha/beta hydrolase, partial [Methyloceanibacter sp.]